jgi:hypothetical protein
MSVARKIRNETKAVSLKLSDLKNGEYLLYKLKAWGPEAIFSIVDEKNRILMKNTDFRNQQHDFSYKWPSTPADIPSEKDIIYTLVVSFKSATKYSYNVELHKADGSSPVTLKSLDFESEKATDSDYNTLRVLFV